MTGTKVGKREGGGIGKGPQDGIRTREAHSATVLYVGVLPTWLLPPTPPVSYHHKHVTNPVNLLGWTFHIIISTGHKFTMCFYSVEQCSQSQTFLFLNAIAN